jgi:DNA repair protein RecO (recombination protein O)
VTARTGRRSLESHDTEALLLRRVDYGDSDLVLTLFTQSLGRISALARSARRSRKRFGGVLEPLHTLSMRLDETAGASLFTLKEARLVVVRNFLASDLARMEAAGRALAWVRKTAPVHTPEPDAWRVLSALLDELDRPETSARLALGAAGLRLLSGFGWGLDLGRCVSCGKLCPDGRSAAVDVLRGGVVCRACGGASRMLKGATRQRLKDDAIEAADVDAALELTEAAFRIHAGVE